MCFVSQAFACKPGREVYDLDAFLASKQVDVRIFSAKVLRVKVHSLADGVIEQEADLLLEKSWIGSPSENLVVRTVSGLMAGTSCAKTFDVEMKESERWFVVATLANGNLMVRPLLSQRFTSELDFEQKLKSVEKYVRERKLEDKK